VEIVASGLGMLEGPVTCQDGSLVVTSLDQGKVFRLAGGHVETLANTGGGANGATEGLGGLIFVAQNGGVAPALNQSRSPAGVQVIEADGTVRIFGQGMRSPNDLCFGPDGFLYVTDPTRKPERDDGRIWRCNIDTRECVQIFACDWYPNGIGFSSDDEWIYVADSRHARIVRLPLADPSLENLETFVRVDHGIPDGFAFDAEDNLVIACPNFAPSGGDVQVYTARKLADVIRPGHSKLYTNLAISSDRQLYLCDADSGNVLCSRWPCAGLPLHPFRPLPLSNS
jgi:gluconolactonase